MWPFTRSKRKLLDKAVAELRDSLENPRVPLSDASAFYSVFGSGMESASGVNVTAENALSVPAIWCAVNFISSTIAALPLILYKKTDAGRERAERDPLYTILHDEVNADCVTSFQWRKYSMVNTLLHGRSVTFIERNKAGRVMNLWPLNPLNTSVERRAGRRYYLYEENGKKFEYRAEEVLDIPFMLEADGLRSISPVARLKNSIGLTLAIEAYASKFFQNGGVPPLALHGPPANAAAVNRALTDIVNAVKNASAEKRNVLYMPAGHELKQIGFDPDKNQLTDVRRFQIEEVSRTYNIPPTFLQDLTHGTYSNTEQLDLHFVKHTLTQWLECWEGELNVKLFPARNRTNFVEFNLDGLLRGDFATRMDGYAKAIQNALMTPNEVREVENRPPLPNGGDLLIQGATVPLGTQPLIAKAGAPTDGGNSDSATQANEGLKLAADAMRSAVDSSSRENERALAAVNRVAAALEQQGPPVVNIEPAVINFSPPNIEVHTPPVNVAPPNIEVHTPPVNVDVKVSKRGDVVKEVTGYDDRGRIIAMTEREIEPEQVEE